VAAPGAWEHFLMQVRMMARAERVRRIAAALATAAALLPSSCSRAIEEEEPVELVEHRIEPCRSWCEPMLSDCGRAADDRPFPNVDECIEDCAGAEPDGNWRWGLQEDGTDACAEEWFLVADCFDGLTCEEHLSFFREDTLGYPPGYPCTDELEAKNDCFYSTPSLDNPGAGR
jgi:hypothetical protein